MAIVSNSPASKSLKGAFFIGIDVQLTRRCPYAVFDATDKMTGCGWLEGKTDQQRCESLLGVVEELRAGRDGLLAFGIDCPRCLRPNRRNYYVDRRKSSWRERRGNEPGVGRHCEVVVKSANIANPQWTPVVGHVRPDKRWMQTGVALFDALTGWEHVYEVFPSASYNLFGELEEVSMHVNLSQFGPGPKDMLDACVAAVTVRRFLNGSGCQVGGADGLGTIVLPVDITDRILRFMQTIPHNLL
jgi:hypothetical protein